jgi:hypothetical protein
VGEVPSAIKELLEEFGDWTPMELPATTNVGYPTKDPRSK